MRAASILVFLLAALSLFAARRTLLEGTPEGRSTAYQAGRVAGSLTMPALLTLLGLHLQKRARSDRRREHERETDEP